MHPCDEGSDMHTARLLHVQPMHVACRKRSAGRVTHRRQVRAHKAHGIRVVLHQLAAVEHNV